MARRGNSYLDRIEYGDGLQYQSLENGEYGYFDERGMTREELLMEYTEKANHLDKVSGVYQRADRIISGEEVSVSVVNDPEMLAHASNNGRDITFNANLIEDLDSNTIASLHGLNYHELSHLLFSPRAGSNLGQFVKEGKALRAFNLLEEGRAETLISNKYPNTRLFLEANVTAHLLKDNPDNWADLFMVTTGRKYLDMELRQMLADKFIAKFGVGLAQEVSDIIHAYRSLVFPTDFDKAKELIARMATIVGTDDMPPQNGSGGGHGERPMLTKGRPIGKGEQEALQKAEGNSPSEKLDGSGDGNNPSDGDGNEKSAEAGHGEGGSNGRSSTQDKYKSADDSLIASKLSDRMKEIISNPAVKREVQDTRSAIAGNEDIRANIPMATYNESTPRPNAIALARKFGTELERIVKDNEPKWDTHLPSGKLNISRTMNPDVNAIGEMFDVWDTGNTDTEIEAVILMDNSSSMGGMMNTVCESAWTIKRGIEAINGNVSVFSFDSTNKKLYDRSERAKPQKYRSLYACGNTQPLRGLIEAERILMGSDKPIKMLFAVTDGWWGSSEECNSIIKRLNSNGILTCVVFISDYDYYKEMLSNSVSTDPDTKSRAVEQLREITHGARVFKAIAEPRDILGVASEVVKASLQKKAS